jgi:hypothetical protein
VFFRGVQVESPPVADGELPAETDRELATR